MSGDENVKDVLIEMLNYIVCKHTQPLLKKKTEQFRNDIISKKQSVKEYEIMGMPGENIIKIPKPVEQYKDGSGEYGGGFLYLFPMNDFCKPGKKPNYRQLANPKTKTMGSGGSGGKGARKRYDMPELVPRK